MGTQREKGSWIESDTTTNGVATATRAAPSAGLRHHVTGITATFSQSAAGIQFELKEGSTTLATFFVHDQFGLVFPSPIQIAPGTAVSAVIQTAGAGIDGSAAITGYTL